MNVGVIGTGTMGRAIGENLAKKGHKVIFGSRTPEKLEAFARSMNGYVRVGSYREAVDASDVVALATPWAPTREIIEELRPFRNKVLLDCTNPEHPEKYELVIGHSTSGGEEIAHWAEGARVVKTLNHVYAEVLYSGASFRGEKASVFYCGNDLAAKQVAAELIRDLGFDAVDAGALSNSRYLEPLAQLLVNLVRVQGHKPADTAYQLLRR